MGAMLKAYQDEHLKELGYALVMQIHDELIFEGPEETAAEALERVRISWSIPFVTAPSWPSHCPWMQPSCRIGLMLKASLWLHQAHQPKTLKLSESQLGPSLATDT